MRGMYRSGSSATAAATTGPARQPRPTSSTPATRLNPSRRIAFSSVLKARTLTTGWPGRSGGLFLGGVLHPRGFALQLAQEVQLRATDPRRPHHVDLVDDRRVKRKDAFDALAERHLPHGKGGTRTSAVHPDHHALEHLNAFLVAFTHLHVNANGVARLDRRALDHVPALDGL